jgi:hypothetical protein
VTRHSADRGGSDGRRGLLGSRDASVVMAIDYSYCDRMREFGGS